MIRWESTVSTTSFTYQPINIDQARIFGAELEMIRRLGKYVKAFFNYTWQDAQNTASNTVITYSPKNKYNLGLIFDHPALSINLSQRFVGEPTIGRVNYVLRLYCGPVKPRWKRA